jgi:anti-sigma regulatory factor (Ser/Thr protein kinase)
VSTATELSDQIHGWQYALELPHQLAAVRVARAATRAAVREADCTALTEAAALITTELVTNALRYTSPGAMAQVGRTTIQLRLTWDGATLEVAVSDPDPALPHTRTPGAESESGRGLLLVDAYADEWGYVPTPGSGKLVWARIGPTA